MENVIRRSKFSGQCHPCVYSGSGPNFAKLYDTATRRPPRLGNIRNELRSYCDSQQDSPNSALSSLVILRGRRNERAGGGDSDFNRGSKGFTQNAIHTIRLFCFVPKLILPRRSTVGEPQLFFPEACT